MTDRPEIKIITPVAIEPVSLAEAKLHIRASSETFAGDIITYQIIAPGNQGLAADYSLLGIAVDVLGKTTLVILDSGTCGAGGSVAAKIQESDDNAIWQDWTGGAFTTVTESNDNATQEKEYTGGKQYIRVAVTVAGATCAFGVSAITKSGDAAEDDLISMFISAAREYCEKYTGRALAAQTIEQIHNYFPRESHIDLLNPPLQSVTSVKYKDCAGVETTMMLNTGYLVDSDRNIGRIVLPYNVSWPSFTAYPINPIRIRCVAGYSASNLIPKSIKQAILLLIGHWYVNREAASLTGIASKEIEFAVKALLSMYRMRWF